MKPLEPTDINFRPLLAARHGSVEARILHGAEGERKTTALALTRQEACLLHALQNAQANVVERRALRSALNTEGESDNLLSKVVSNLRKKLRASGVALEIHAVHGRGYQMGVRA